MNSPRATGTTLDVPTWLAASGFAVGVMVLVTSMRFDETLSSKLPPMPPKPTAKKAEAALRDADYSPAMYNAYLAQDANEAGIAFSPTELRQPFDYVASNVDKRLKAKKQTSIETPTLKLSARVEKLTATSASGSYRTEHLILTITNKTDKYLAYRVTTKPSGGGSRCTRKGDLAHNAMVLKPGQVVRRTECVYRKGMSLKVVRIETMTIPRLSYEYVGRLYPPHVGMDARPTRGHQPTSDRACSTIPEQAIRRAMDTGTASWRDVIDFYARHRCETYLFPVGYKAFTRPDERSLPVAPGTVSRP